MKTIMLFIFFLGCTSIRAQNIAPASSNLIVIQTNDKVMNALDKMWHLFLREGYDTEREFESAPFLLITTKITDRSYGPSPAETLAVRFTASVDKSDSGAVVSLKGLYSPHASRYSHLDDSASIARARKLFFASAQEIRMDRDAGSSLRHAWNLMDILASKYGSSKVYYRTVTH